MTDRIILCSSKASAYALSEKMCDEENERLNNPTPKAERSTTTLLDVNENVLSGQFGLELPSNMIERVSASYQENTVVKTPLWIPEKKINGDPFFAIGIGPFGIAQVNPKENRKILEGQFSKKVIDEARNSARKYTIEIQNTARNFIDDFLNKPTIQDKLMSELNSDLFEELVAEILVDKGFDIFITPKTRDGGKDIIAAYSFDGKPVVMMVECKRRKTNHTLGPVELRSLVGQFYYEKLQNSQINYGLLVTSAGAIGKTGLDMAEKINEISVKGYSDLQDWISKYGKSKNGLWLPQNFCDFFH